MRRALARDRANLYALGGLGSLALSRHRFREALLLGRRAQRLSPSTARTYGVIGDALVELGRYRQAFRAYDRMAALKPSLAAYARVSHARELLGDRRGAISAMQLAVDAAGAQAEPRAWSLVQLGKLRFSGGRLDSRSARVPRRSRRLPRLRVRARRPRPGRGRPRAPCPRIVVAAQAVERQPLPEHVGFLGDLYRAQGRTRLAREQYDLVGAIGRLLVANGVRTELETALFDVDHGLRLRESLATARRAHSDRPSIEADDVLAWALARNGRCAEALTYSRRALRLGTRDALKYLPPRDDRALPRRPAAGARWFARALA